MSKACKRPAVLMTSVEEDKVITAAAKADPDAQALTTKQLKAMKFSELRTQMSPQAQSRSAARAKAMLAEIQLEELRKIRQV